MRILLSDEIILQTASRFFPMDEQFPTIHKLKIAKIASASWTPAQ